MSFTTEAARWRALVTRDAKANGQFIYSVKSTSIYCRPTCPGRLARRANIGFYETAREAEAAGFRACKRCKPNTVLEDPQGRAVDKACLLIDEALMKDDSKMFRLQDLAKKVGLTPRYFHKIFKDKTGLTPKEYAKQKESSRGSSSTTPISSTSTSSSVPTSNFSTFDFNDMIDYGINLEEDNTDMDTHPSYLVRSRSFPNLGAVSCGDDVAYAWPTVFDPTNTLPMFATEEHWFVDPFTSPGLSTIQYKYKPMSAVPTFELDAAALLSCDDITSVAPM
ncbi:hypothetical protein T440DRAFT_156006 [Plenodomus tracheiphilus IPT5]|uniref:HTH araC/xylS-type domain-containing protein n=1 Tax=Plenodomus tracheiphilus IPT5 TaxID=1408161 RepID=A0A6A7BJL6_9PLEO|nr:hypothetical protein T440DRAFT_156006 [Plenodomus tracheiphilus IPT5]